VVNIYYSNPDIREVFNSFSRQQTNSIKTLDNRISQLEFKMETIGKIKSIHHTLISYLRL